MRTGERAFLHLLPSPSKKSHVRTYDLHSRSQVRRSPSISRTDEDRSIWQLPDWSIVVLLSLGLGFVAPPGSPVHLDVVESCGRQERFRATVSFFFLFFLLFSSSREGQELLS
jgi:hypothetical protein